MKADKKKMAEAAPESAPGASKKKLMIIILAAVLVLAGSAGGAWFFTRATATKATAAASAPPPEEEKGPPAGPPVFVNVEPFVVNLQNEGSEQFLQTTFTLQVGTQAQADLIKLHMPQVRNRLLVLLSGKKSAEISTTEGKQKLTDEMIAEVKRPFPPSTRTQDVTGVFFTSFIIQ